MIQIYTDGSCMGNGKRVNKGGWAYVITTNNEEIYKESGGELCTTNNRMELTAVINALIKVLPDSDSIIEVYTDSSYIVNCYKEKWWKNWEKNNWVNSKKQPVKNKDLWEKLVKYFNKPQYKFYHVKGHNGDKFNECVDKMAVAAATKIGDKE